jgi:[ribosomal protein S18]-alanine N-acetyltransferase
MEFPDLAQIIAIERSSFSDPWPEFAFLRAISTSTCHTRVVRKDGTVAGYLVGYINGPEMHIANVAVRPDFRRQGVARALLIEVLANGEIDCDHAILDVRESNQSAIRLYESLGFRRVGRRRAYYRYPSEDALVMRVELQKP